MVVKGGEGGEEEDGVVVLGISVRFKSG